MRYLQAIVESYVPSFLTRIENPIYQQNNAPPHVARVGLNFFEATHVNFKPCPLRSCDLSLIDNFWLIMGRIEG